MRKYLPVLALLLAAVFTGCTHKTSVEVDASNITGENAKAFLNACNEEHFNGECKLVVHDVSLEKFRADDAAAAAIKRGNAEDSEQKAHRNWLSSLLGINNCVMFCGEQTIGATPDCNHCTPAPAKKYCPRPAGNGSHKPAPVVTAPIATTIAPPPDTQDSRAEIDAYWNDIFHGSAKASTAAAPIQQQVNNQVVNVAAPAPQPQPAPVTSAPQSQYVPDQQQWDFVPAADYIEPQPYYNESVSEFNIRVSNYRTNYQHSHPGCMRPRGGGYQQRPPVYRQPPSRPQPPQGGRGCSNCQNTGTNGVGGTNSSPSAPGGGGQPGRSGYVPTGGAAPVSTPFLPRSTNGSGVTYNNRSMQPAYNGGNRVSGFGGSRGGFSGGGNSRGGGSRGGGGGRR